MPVETGHSTIGRGVGRFLPQTHASRSVQLWVAGGVGTMPFLVVLERIEPDSNARVTLIYCIRSRASAGAIEDIERHAARLLQVDLFVLSDTEADRLTSTRLMEIMRVMQSNAEVHLCGPEGLKAIVKTTWITLGRAGRIHSERFDFRGAYGLTDLIYIGKPALDTARTWMAERKDIANAAVGT